MKKLLIMFVFFIPINLYSLGSYVVMDSDSGRILESNNMNEKMLIASTTKIMSTINVLENHDITEVICAGEEIKKVYGSMLYLEVGECLNVYDLLVGLMLRSGNDAAMVLASHDNYENFINGMNSIANRLNMKNTTFENPHGLDDDSKNTSSAKDLALLMNYAIKNDVFKEIMSIKKYITFSSLKDHVWYNKNKLLSSYKYATGGKIGYTTKSGHIFVSSASKARENLIVVTMKDDNQFVTHKNLYETIFKKYDKYKVIDKYTFSLKEDYYKKYHLYIKEDMEVMLSKEELDDIKFDIYLEKKQSISNNEIVGKVKVFVKEEFINEINIYAFKNDTIKNAEKIFKFFKFK